MLLLRHERKRDMKIVCASSVLRAAETFSALGRVEVIDDECITRRDLLDADALITRSKTRIDRALLEGTSVRFVGCAVAGTDHIDKDWLDTTEIACCHAPGCNANSVAEYIVSSLLHEVRAHSLVMNELTLGVIGVGHIGTRVVEKAMDLGITVLQNDPPRAAAERGGHDLFLSLEEVLARSDLISLHVPLIENGPYATRDLADHRFFEALQPGALLFNTSRGEVLDSDALLRALDHGVVRQAVLDVWEDEPRIRKDVLDAVDIGTPHIAGYSHEGRLEGTRMVYEELCHYLEIDPDETVFEWPDNGADPEHTMDARGRTMQEVLTEMALTAYPVHDDDRRFRDGASADPETMGRHFTACRRDYPTRREYGAARFHLLHGADPLLTTAWKLGFQIAE